MKKILFLTLATLFWNPASASVLGDAAAALPDRTWTKLSSNASLNGLNIPYALLYWADSGCWDPVNRRMTWVGYPGGCCGGGAGINYSMLTFTESSNTWTVSSTNFNAGGYGHSFDGNALDPATGDHYFTLYNSRQVRKWNGQSWTVLPNIPSGASPSMAVAWFPDINNGQGGLVHVNGGGQVAWFNGTAWTALSGAQTGSYNLFAEYNPVQKAVWLGAGNGSERVNYKLDAQLHFTRLTDAPVSLNVGASLKSVDPASGKHIVTDLSSGAFWEFDMAQNKWSSLTGMKGTVPNLGGERPWLHVPISSHGVILYFFHNYDQRDIYLYKHGNGMAAETGKAPPQAGLSGLSVSPNPCKTSVKLKANPWTAGDKGHAEVEIFTLNGARTGLRTVSGLAIAEGVDWNVTHLPAGIYLARVSRGSSVYTGRFVVWR